MTTTRQSNDQIRILFSEGSSTNAREMITCLGLLGYRVDICDPNPFCLGRFSRIVRKVYRCPLSGDDPLGYLDFIINILKSQKYDVLFPANEQAYLFAWVKDVLTPLTGLAVADFAAFNRVQTKTAFMRLLDELSLHHPETRYAKSWPEIEHAVEAFPPPVFLKTAYGTASTGVWRIENRESLEKTRAQLETLELLNGQTDFLIQRMAQGIFEQSHAIFEHGRLIALRCTRRLVEGAQGGAALKVGVYHPELRHDFEQMGQALGWHGSLSIDYFWDEENHCASYIDCNPRITEPVNAMVNGVNLADLQVRLSLGESLEPLPDGTATAKSHELMQVMFGAAGWRGSRRDVIRATYEAASHKGLFQGSQEGLTPVKHDLPSIMPLAVIFLSLLIDPGSKVSLTLNTISNYSLGTAIPRLAELNVEEWKGFQAKEQQPASP